jgi:hypothetical protein
MSNYIGRRNGRWQYDGIVIGTSQGGRSLPLELAHAGQRVALVERGELGAVCVNRGCWQKASTPCSRCSTPKLDSPPSQWVPWSVAAVATVPPLQQLAQLAQVIPS